MKAGFSKILNITLGVTTIFLTMKQFKMNKTEKRNSNDKMSLYYSLLNKWMSLRERGSSVSDYLNRRGFQTIAIYGLGDIGRHLYKELENSNITVLYAIDRSFYAVIELDVYSPEGDFPAVDAIIVTPVMEYDHICGELKKKVSCPILSIADIMNYLIEDNVKET